MDIGFYSYLFEDETIKAKDQHMKLLEASLKRRIKGLEEQLEVRN